MTPYTLSTPEGRAEVRRLARSVASACDCDDPRTMEPCAHCWQVSRTLFAALEEIERLERELAKSKAVTVDKVAVFDEWARAFNDEPSEAECACWRCR